MNSELMRRAAITMGALLVYRIGIQVQLPGIAAREAFFRPRAGSILGMVNMSAVLGGAFVAAVALVPEALITYAQLPFYFGGVSMLIVVCTVLDLQAQVRGYKFITISRERQR